MPRLATAMGLMVLMCTAFLQAANAEIKEPKIYSRLDWKAADPQKKRMVEQFPPKGIVIHHTAVEEKYLPRVRAVPSLNRIRNIQHGHQTDNRQRYRPPPLKGQLWGDFAYHYYIGVDGKIIKGRDIAYEGDSNTNYTMTQLLLVVLEGNFDIEQPAKEQLASLDQLVPWLAAQYGIDPEQITPHDGHVNTNCPGLYLKKYLGELKKKTADALKKG